MKKLCWVVGAIALAAAGGAYAEDGPFDLSKNCGSCHALAKPADASFERIWTRKAPDLWYAGDKFKQDWLVDWLQNPTPIRPAGYPYFMNITQGTDHDEVDASKLTPHPKLTKGDASAAA